MERDMSPALCRVETVLLHEIVSTQKWSRASTPAPRCAEVVPANDANAMPSRSSRSAAHAKRFSNSSAALQRAACPSRTHQGGRQPRPKSIVDDSSTLLVDAIATGNRGNGFESGSPQQRQGRSASRRAFRSHAVFFAAPKTQRVSASTAADVCSSSRIRRRGSGLRAQIVRGSAISCAGEALRLSA